MAKRITFLGSMTDSDYLKKEKIMNGSDCIYIYQRRRICWKAKERPSISLKKYLTGTTRSMMKESM